MTALAWPLSCCPQIIQYQHKIEEMQIEFAQMLRETLDRMHDRLANTSAFK